MLTITIHDTNTERYTYTASANILGRRYDNIAEYVSVVKPESETGRDCVMIVTYGDTVVDHIPVGDTPIAITSNLSQYASVKIGFAFLGADGYIKNSEVKQFYFLTAQKPDGFVPLPPEQKTTVEYLLSHGFTGAKLEKNILSFANAAGDTVVEIKLSGFIQEQADWNETNAEAETYIKNKPTKLSQFTNDSGFVTGTDISRKADKSYVDAELAKKQPTGNYATAESLNAHTGNTNNPHGVTAAQVGAYVKPSDGIPETDLSEEVQAKLNSGDGAQNLLKGDVTVGDFDINDAKGSNVGYPLGIEVGKKYNITATVNGKEYTVAGDGMDMEGVTLLANASSPELLIELADFRFIGYDKASFTVGNDAPLPDDNNSLFMVMGEGYKTATIIVKSITEIEEVIADKVKNKLKITVNGAAKEYDGSEAVEVDINTGNSAENLLKGDVTVTVVDGSLNNLVELGYPLGISADKSYKVVVEYNGEIIDILIKSSDWHKNETAVGGIASISSAVQIVVYDGMSSDLTINPDNACLGIDRGATSGSLTIIFKSITEVEEPLATYKIKQISVSSGETMSSVVTKITDAVAEELTAQSRYSAVVTVALNGLTICDAVMSGGSAGRVFLETSYMSVTSGVGESSIVFSTPLVRAVGDSTSVWGSGIWAVCVQFGKYNSNIIASTGASGIGTENGSASFKDLSNFVSDSDTTLDIIIY